jgi:hypothetical protein
LSVNTHKSATLVKWIAEQCAIEDELSEKGKDSILQNIASKAEFLQNEKHRIGLIYSCTKISRY